MTLFLEPLDGGLPQKLPFSADLTRAAALRREENNVVGGIFPLLDMGAAASGNVGRRKGWPLREPQVLVKPRKIEAVLQFCSASAAAYDTLVTGMGLAGRR